MLSVSQIREYCSRLELYLLSLSQDNMLSGIVNAPFMEKLKAVQLDLGIVVLLIVDEKNKTIRRVALSDTEMAKGAISVSRKKFEEILIPLDFNQNIIAHSINSNQINNTDDWQYLFMPDMDADDARMNQAAAGIGSSVVSPVKFKNARGALIYSFYQPLFLISEEHFVFVKTYSKKMAKLKLPDGLNA